MGVDTQEIASALVEKFGEEEAFLIYYAAKTYIKILRIPND
jgi:hypothetical protein